MPASRWLALVFALSACGCECGDPSFDGGPPPRDGGAFDARDDLDASGLDGGARDAALGDAGSEDAGAMDAGRADAGPGLECPATLPADGAPCDRPGLCGYFDCASFGAGRARCDGTSFTVTTEACGPVSCRPEPCPAGQYCVILIAGAVNGMCFDVPTGPLTCDSVCGGPCINVLEGSDPPERFECDACAEPPCA